MAFWDRRLTGLNASTTYKLRALDVNAGRNNTAKIEESLGVSINNIVTANFNGNLSVNSGTLEIYSDMAVLAVVVLIKVLPVIVSTAGPNIDGFRRTVDLATTPCYASQGVSFTNASTGALLSRVSLSRPNSGTDVSRASYFTNNGKWIISGASRPIQKSNFTSNSDLLQYRTLTGSGRAISSPTRI